jgi:hypothetical protein
MSELNELETQLRALVPRPPSAGLKKRIFAASPTAPRPAAAATPSPRHPAWAWLAPAMAAVLVVAVLYNQHSGSVSVSSDSSPMVAMALSNQSVAAWLPGSFSRDRNDLPQETLEWTNGSRSTSSIGSLSGSRGTN